MASWAGDFVARYRILDIGSTTCSQAIPCSEILKCHTNSQLSDPRQSIMQFLSQQPWNVTNLKPIRLLVAFLFMTLCVTSRALFMPIHHGGGPTHGVGAICQSHGGLSGAFSKDPKDARYPYNAGVAAYRAKLYDQAQEHLDAASLAQDLQLQQQAFYNRETAFSRQGSRSRIVKKPRLWEALSNTRTLWS